MAWSAFCCRHSVTTEPWREQLPCLAGNLLDLREIAYCDASSLLCLITEDPYVRQYISSPPPSIEAYEGFVAWCHRKRAEGTSVCFAIVPHGLRQAVGMFQVRSLDEKFLSAEWGFVLGSAFWSTGVFEEAAALVADFAFGTLHVQRLEARAATVNKRGNGALTKLGAVGEAILRQALERDGTYHEQLLWSILAEEWNARRVLERDRFSEVLVKQNIQDAIGQMQQHLAGRGTQEIVARYAAVPVFHRRPREAGRRRH